MKKSIQSKEPSIIKVIGVGGGGSNAVTHMYNQGIIGVDFAICNTDSQAMQNSPVPVTIALGPHLTDGRGAGNKPEIGKEACIESIDEIRNFLGNKTKMLFVTAGMGGGTGTGAAPIIAKAARELDILTVGIVTLPFQFEGMKRQRQAFEGLELLRKNVDAILVISNEKLRQLNCNLALSSTFAKADDILAIAAKGIAEIITIKGYINVDFEDVNTVMRDTGVAIMGSATVEGEDRARKAIEQAINSPLLEENDIRGAKHILLNITSGTKEVTMEELSEITDYVQEEAGFGTDIIWGNCNDQNLGDAISITLIATGFKEGSQSKKDTSRKKKFVGLDDDQSITGDNQMSTIYASDISENIIDFDVDDVQRTIENIDINANKVVVDLDNDRHEKPSSDHHRMKRAKKRNITIEQPTIPLDNPKIVADMENTPAYERRKVDLEDVNQASMAPRVGYTISVDDEGSLIETRNKFLHNNVD